MHQKEKKFTEIKRQTVYVDNITSFNIKWSLSKINTPFFSYFYTLHSSLFNLTLHSSLLTLNPPLVTLHPLTFNLTEDVGVWHRRNPCLFIHLLVHMFKYRRCLYFPNLKNSFFLLFIVCVQLRKFLCENTHAKTWKSYLQNIWQLQIL